MRAHLLAIRWSLGLMALVFGACFAPNYPTGIPCSELDTCPPGQSCIEGICWAEATVLDPDAMPGAPDASPGAPDATPDAMPVPCTTAAECDDGIACTSEACLNNLCVYTPDDSACADDDITCTVPRCDPARDGCVFEPEDSACSDGIDCTTDRCDLAEGCVAAPDDALCDDGVDCTSDRCTLEDCVNAPDDAVCNDGDTCTADSCDVTRDCINDAPPFCSSQCLAVLIFNESPDNDLAVRAVEALGMTATVTAVEDEFLAAFDAGGFDLIIVDSSGENIPPGVTTRLVSWIEGGGKLVFSYWDLDGSPELQAALDVRVVRSIEFSPPVHTSPGSPVDFFQLVDVFFSPLVFDDFATDNGDVIAVAGAGFVAARFGAATSPDAAIVVTREDRVIVMGFLPWDIFNSELDADEDGTNDGDELYRNQMRFLCSGL